MSNKIRTTIVLDAPLAEQARQVAASTGGNLSRYINNLIKRDIEGVGSELLTDGPESIFGKYTGGKKIPYDSRDELYEKDYE